MSTEKIFSVAVDGPSGAGKSTISKAVAKELGILYVDTGALYRTIGLYTKRQNVNPKDPVAVVALLPRIHVEMAYASDGLQHMMLNGEDVTTQIRLPEISMYASDVSAIPAVREFLMDMQRDLAKKHSVIMDGRDIGTVVLPDADVKIFLYADVEVRAKRRVKELAERGTPRSYEEVLREMEERDYQDTHRETCPLRPAEDSIMVDSSDLGFFSVRNLLIDMIQGSVGL